MRTVKIISFSIFFLYAGSLLLIVGWDSYLEKLTHRMDNYTGISPKHYRTGLILGRLILLTVTLIINYIAMVLTKYYLSEY